MNWLRRALCAHDWSDWTTPAVLRWSTMTSTHPTQGTYRECWKCGRVAAARWDPWEPYTEGGGDAADV